MLGLLIFCGGTIAALGHAFLWAAFVNQVHSRGWPRILVKALSWPALLVVIPVGSLQFLYRTWTALQQSDSAAELSDQLNLYDWVCIGLGCWALLRWIIRRFWGDPWRIVVSAQVERIDVERELQQSLTSGTAAKILACWPWNESRLLEIRTETIPVPRLPTALSGLRIAHLADWHLTGRIKRQYYEYLVTRLMQSEPDLICITGDLMDHADCLDWLPDLFGRLQAPQGCYYILGNHDPRCGDLPRLHSILTTAGWIDAGGCWRQVSLRGVPTLIAGNEFPWLGPASDLSYAPREVNGRPLFRLLLAHSPDQFDTAVEHDFDLQLSGHTHGGQIALPGIGPIFAPSAYGVRLACGTFRRKNTVLHVTRGISSNRPIRQGAPPTVSLLTLHAAEPAA